MTQKQGKKKREVSGLPRRKERRFKTSAAFITIPVAVVGMLGSLLLGCGVFGLWVIDPPVSYAAYMVAVGGLGLGAALWFGQPSETAVAVGDGGIAVEDGREVLRVRWFDMKGIRLEKGKLVVSSRSKSISFLVGANPKATGLALSEAKRRVPGVLDVDAEFLSAYPAPTDGSGAETPIDDDQVAGHACASSGRTIQLEEDARLCGHCGQIYHRDYVPSVCVTCEGSLEGRLLRV